jgi:hypothetical protein
LDLTGRPVPPGGQVDGRELFVERLDAAVSFVLWRRARDARTAIGARAAAAPGQAPVAVSRREPAWFGWDDPLPFAAVTAGFARKILVKTGRRAGSLLRAAAGARCPDDGS